MDINQVVIGQIAGVVAFISSIPYFISILRGGTKPSRAGYAIWAVVEVLWIASYIVAGATTTKWTGIVFAFTAVTIFLLSLKYGMGGLSTFDIPCLILAAVAIYFWVTTNNPVVAVHMSTLAVFLGYLPIVKKCYLWPKTENTLSWSLYAVSAILNVFALTTLAPNVSIRPFMSLCIALIIATLLLFPDWRFAQKKPIAVVE